MSNPRQSGSHCEAGDDHWIFEQLGSPEKSGRRFSSSSNDNSLNLIRSSFDEKLRIYADNMRKLIITARKQINDLKLENNSLKQKLQASGLTECPACLFHFKPEREHRVLPKYIKVFRGNFSVEIKFSSLEEMSEWLTLNKLDENRDGLPTLMQCEDQKMDLVSTGSLIYKLVKEKLEIEAKKKKVVINIRPHDKISNEMASSTATRRLPLRKGIISRTASALPKASKIECLENEYPKEIIKGSVKGASTSCHVNPTSSTSKHNQCEARSVVRQCRDIHLLEGNQVEELATQLKCYSSPLSTISDSRMHGQDENRYDDEECFRQGCFTVLEEKNVDLPADALLHSSSEKECRSHQDPSKQMHSSTRSDKLTELHSSGANNFVERSEGILNKYVPHVTNEEKKLGHQFRQSTSVKEDCAASTCKNVEIYSRARVHEKISKRSTHTKLEKHRGTSLSSKLSESTCDIEFDSKGQKEDLEKDRRHWQDVHRNEVCNDSKSIKTREGRTRRNEHENENRRVDTEKRRRSETLSEVTLYRNYSKSSCQRDDTSEIRHEDFDSEEAKEERYSTEGSSKGIFTSSKIKQVANSVVSNHGEMSYRCHSFEVVDAVSQNRISRSGSSAGLSPQRSTQRIYRQQRMSKHPRNRDYTREFKHDNSKRSTRAESRRRNVLRTSVDSRANTVSPLHSPRLKRRKLSKSPPRLGNEDSASPDYDATSISSSDLVVIDEEEVEDGEIVE